MARYIDTEKAKTFFEEIDAGSRAHITLLTPYEFAEYLDEIPAADVVEVKHAKFELVSSGKGVCSNCHRLDYIDELAKYCRYCGAKLD